MLRRGYCVYRHMIQQHSNKETIIDLMDIGWCKIVQLS